MFTEVPGVTLPGQQHSEEMLGIGLKNASSEQKNRTANQVFAHGSLH